METLQMWAIGLGVTVAISAFIRFFPKKKMMDAVGPVCFNAGKALSAILLAKIGKKAAEKVEEGIIVTLLSIVSHAVEQFGKGLILDNEPKEAQKRLKESSKK